MRYIVTVDGERVEVVLDGARAQVNGRVEVVRLAEVGSTPTRVVTIGNATHQVAVRRGESRGQYTLWLGGYRFEVEALDERTRAIRDLTAAAATAAGPRPLVAPMPGLIVRIAVQVGDPVEAGQAIVAMEAMKMENELRATAGGTVRSILVRPGMAVEKGAALVEFDAG